MAKHVIVEQYAFTPGTNTIVITGKNIRREQLLLITNVTRGTVIYNFSDPSLGAASYTNAVAPSTNLETTTIVTSYNTTAMSSTDKLAIMVEEAYSDITPAETLMDPVGKMRVSTPQSLIDTDFEYGLQPTKWESITLLNNRPSAFYEVTNPITTITNVTASGNVVTVALTSTTGLAVGQPFFITGTLDTANADGWWVIDTLSSNTNFTFRTYNAAAAALWDATKTYAYGGSFYTGAGIPTTSITLAAGAATVTTTAAHGLSVGNHVYIVGTTGVSGMNGTWVVATTPTNNTFTITTALTGTVTLAGGASATLYVRQQGYVLHRPFDGGVQFTNQLPDHNYQVIRQTRRYFRYQSGKGVQFSTGSILKPALNVDSITSVGTTVTVTCKYQHGIAPGGQIQVSGCNESAYNGIFTVVSAPTTLTLTYTALTTPSATPATALASTATFTVSPYSWYGSRNRVGMFDQQNGFFFEFDGQQLYAVKRSSTSQLSGTVAVTAAGNTVTGTGTYFSNQLKPGDMIVIRGQSYTITTIVSDTSMQIYPEYRGTTATRCILSKTIDQRYPQSAWNIDKADGTGQSLFNIDLTKMQMFYIDYSWYGAGAIRFGFKNNRGEVTYVHRIVNSNVNTEAYMRSGNLPSRYETNTFAYYTNLLATVSNTATTGATITGTDFSLWPNAGTAIITASGATGAAIEYITYTSRTNTTLTIGARAQAGGNSTAQTFTYSATAPIQISFYSPSQASTISHWGSSVVMDGRFDDDKSFVFQSGMNTAITNIGAGVRNALISIRLAPSVDNGLTGLLGARELINRMQLTLRAMGAYVTGTNMAFRIELIINGRPSGGTFAPVGGSSLAQVAYHTSGQTVAGGETIFSFFVSANGSATTQDLNLVRDLGTNILGGGTSLNVPTTTANVYPDGPDMVTICATNITSVTTNSINARISWTEAQA